MCIHDLQCEPNVGYQKLSIWIRLCNRFCLLGKYTAGMRILSRFPALHFNIRDGDSDVTHAHLEHSHLKYIYIYNDEWVTKQMNRTNLNVVDANCIYSYADSEDRVWALCLTAQGRIGLDKQRPPWGSSNCYLISARWWTSTRYSLALCPVEVQLMPSSLFASCRRSTLLLTNCSILPSLTLRKPEIVCQGRSHGGPQGASGSWNGLCVSSRACTPMPGVVCGSMASTVRNLAWELVRTRTLVSAHCFSSWC